jgi:isoaspartyl peptidase/L-asparaginase-like protein (Ntn-hydrolase superfamily)
VAGHAYGIGYVRGVVDRIDYRNVTLIVRDLANGRLVTATTAGGRFPIRNLRRGDRVQLTGKWIRNGVFNVTRIKRV